MLKVRGVPGTHDMPLLNAVLSALGRAAPSSPVLSPVFDKLADDVLPKSAWQSHRRPPGAVLLEGWCLGARPQSVAELAEPVNDLERTADSAGPWRSFANDQLKGPYAALFARMDAIAYLQAPSFTIVETWRREQEEAALGRALTPAEAARLNAFIAHFERITRSMLAGHRRSEITLVLDERRNLLAVA